MLVFGKIYARLINKNEMELDEVPEKYQEVTKQAYKELFGIEI